MAPAFLEPRLWGAFSDSGQVRVTPHHERALAPHAAARQGHFMVGFVGGNGDVRGSEGQAFSPAHQLVSEAAPLKLRIVELGIQVMVIEDKSNVKKFEEDPDQEDDVRWVTGMDDTEAGARVDPQGKEKLGRQRPAIFQEVTERPGGLPQPVPVNLNAFHVLATLLESGAFRADDGNTISGVAQGACFLHYPAVERDGQVF